MANITIGNNGQEAKREVNADPDNGIEWQPACEATPDIKITYPSGLVKKLSPGESIGLEMGKYVIEVI